MDITKNNYYKYFKNRKAWRNYKKALKANPVIFSKYFRPAKSPIYNPLGVSIQGGKDNRYWNFS